MRPMTLEGCVVRISDLIAYLGKDIEDAIRQKLITKDMIPKNVQKVLGTTNKAIPAISISLNKIRFVINPFATYESNTFPNTNPHTTPIFPNLFNIPAIIPHIA